MKKLLLVLAILSISSKMFSRTVNVFNPFNGRIQLVVDGRNYNLIPAKQTSNINIGSYAQIFITTDNENLKPDEIPAKTCTYTSEGQRFQFTESNRYIIRLDKCIESMAPGGCTCFFRLEPRP